MGQCSHCKETVHRADRFVVTLSDKTLHVNCVAAHFALIRAGHERHGPEIEEPAAKSGWRIAGDEDPF